MKKNGIKKWESMVFASATCMFIMLLAACNGKLVYDKYANTPLSGWEKNDTLSFEVSPVNTTDIYSAELGLRINDSYPFTSLTLIVEQHFFPDDVIKTDTVRCQLSDRLGNAVGKGVSYHQYQFHISSTQLNAGDSIHIRVRHDMKREILPGISDVGIMLRKTK